MADTIRVIYVDDEPDLLDIGKVFLEQAGDFSVVTIGSVMAALDLLKNEPFDAIISDYQMPGMDGIQLLVEVRKRFGPIPFILFTGRGREEVVIRALNEGADFYLQKGGEPVSQFTELAHKIRQAVQQRHADLRIRDHERREADIINFQPDATFAIDTNGVVIAWNRAMEEITGVSAIEMLGKGNYEYSIPVYHERRPILIDLVLRDDPAIAAKYPSMKRNGRTLVAESTSLHLYNGRGATIWFTAAPLYNNQGEVVGAIESIRDITDRKRAEEALFESEALFRSLVENIQDPVVILSFDGTILFANPVTSRFTGPQGTGVPEKRSIMSYLDPGSLAQAIADLDEIRRTGGPLFAEYYINPIPGERRCVEACGVRIVYKGSEADLVTLRDITDRKSAEESVRKSEERYRQVVENAGEAIVVAQDNRLVFANPKSLEMLHTTSEKVLTRPFTDYIHPDDRLLVFDRYQRRVSGENVPDDYDFRLQTETGDNIWVHISSVKIEWDEKPATLNFITDITERKSAEDSVRKSEERYRSVIENIQDVYYRSDRDGNLVMVSPSIFTLLGYESTEEMIGKSITDTFYPDHEERKRFLDAMDHIGSVRDFETRLRKKDGMPVVVSTSSHYYYDAQGEIAGVEGIFRDITGKKKVDEAREDSKRRLSEIISFLPDATFAIDRNGTVISWNQAMEEMTGVPADQILGKGNYEYAVPFYGIRRPILIDLVFSPRSEISKKYSFFEVDGEVLTAETVEASPQGNNVTLWGKAAPLYDSEGNVTGAIESIRDITDRKLAEEKALLAREEWERTFNALPDLICILDKQHTILAVNRAMAGKLGMAPEQALGLSCYQCVHGTQSPPDYCPHARLLKDQQEHTMEIYEDQLGGHFLVTCTPLRDKGGQLIGSVHVARDITERKRTEEALMHLTEFQESVISNARVWLSVLDMRGVILMWNTAAEEISGYSSGEVIGQKEIWKKIYPDKEYRKQITDTITRIILEKNYLENFETTILTKQGIRKVISWNTRGIPGLKGTISDYIAIGVDITDRKLAEKALRDANKKLTLLSGITRHDISNQLLALDGFLNLLHNKARDPTLEDYFTRITKASSRISAMIRFTKEYEQIGVHAPIWENCRTLVDTAAWQAPLGQVMVDNDLPAGAEVFADPLITRVFYNLMDNAVRYGGKITTIRFSASDRSGNLVIVCEDDGNGVPGDEKERIFERGFGKNTGLGLFFSREVLAITGSTITETGEPGTGARFEIIMPNGTWRMAGTDREGNR